MMKKRLLIAFTLAEVLIVIGIIGIIAEITIPTLIQNVQDQITAGMLKKEYSILSQAFTMAVQENGTPDSWDLVGAGSVPGAKNMLNTLAPYLKVTKNCADSGTCWPTGYTKYLNGADSPFDHNTAPFASATLIDGTLISTDIHSATCSENNSVSGASMLTNVCGTINVDINGAKKPNKYGADVFAFWITKSGMTPSGIQDDNFLKFTTHCQNKTTDGESCAAWIIYNNNMDYMHCNDLSWASKLKCN